MAAVISRPPDSARRLAAPPVLVKDRFNRAHRARRGVCHAVVVGANVPLAASTGSAAVVGLSARDAGVSKPNDGVPERKSARSGNGCQTDGGVGATMLDGLRWSLG
jgi:hypothetical protein